MFNKFIRWLMSISKLTEELWQDNSPGYSAWLQDRIVIDSKIQKDKLYWNHVADIRANAAYMNELSEHQYDIEKKISLYICEGNLDKARRYSDMLKGVKGVNGIIRKAIDNIYKMEKKQNVT